MCDLWSNVDCSKSRQFYSLNAQIGVVEGENGAVDQNVYIDGFDSSSLQGVSSSSGGNFLGTTGVPGSSNFGGIGGTAGLTGSGVSGVQLTGTGGLGGQFPGAGGTGVPTQFPGFSATGLGATGSPTPSFLVSGNQIAQVSSVATGVQAPSYNYLTPASPFRPAGRPGGRVPEANNVPTNVQPPTRLYFSPN